MNQRLKLIGFTLFLTLGLFSLSPHWGQAQSVSSLAARVSRLESENFQLRSRLSRLENRIGQVNRPTPTLPQTSPPPELSDRPSAATDPMFDRLATLVIELKERVQALEVEVARLREE